MLNRIYRLTITLHQMGERRGICGMGKQVGAIAEKRPALKGNLLSSSLYKP